MPAAVDVPLQAEATQQSGSLLARLSSTVEITADDQTPTLSELKRWKAGEGGKGNPDFPLVWWKVCIYQMVCTVH